MFKFLRDSYTVPMNILNFCCTQIQVNVETMLDVYIWLKIV